MKRSLLAVQRCPTVMLMPTKTTQDATAPPHGTLWLTKADAAKYAKIGPKLIANAGASGELPAYPIGTGREYRLRAIDIDQWLMSRAWEPNA